MSAIVPEADTGTAGVYEYTSSLDRVPFRSNRNAVCLSYIVFRKAGGHHRIKSGGRLFRKML